MLYNFQFLLQFHLVHVLLFGKIVGQKFEEYALKIYWSFHLKIIFQAEYKHKEYFAPSWKKKEYLKFP